MKHWCETAAILERVTHLAQTGGSAALATVVRISGSAYRRPGAKFLVEEDGRTQGGLSGGCLEADVREVGFRAMRSGSPRLLHYETGSNENTVWGLGLGCEGAVDIFVQPAGSEYARGIGARVRQLLLGSVPFAICTLVEGPLTGSAAVWGQGSLLGAGMDAQLAEAASPLVEQGESGLVKIGPHTVFTDVLSPPPALVVFGGGDDARPLVALAVETNFDVTVVDHRSAYLTHQRFPPPARLVLRRASDGVQGLGLGRRHFAVVQTHALAHDRDWLRELLQQPLAYLGLLGPRARKESLLKELGVTDGARLFAPVGLDLGADGPEQVAVSIVAEMLAVLNGREPLHLRAKTRGIHDA
jgi:xanthine dehydrogenase accessory factor